MSVALLAEGVDRNAKSNNASYQKKTVALLAEGVDRNWTVTCLCVSMQVALLAEGVDRNAPTFDPQDWGGRSPSSRRAWIEIRNL